MQTVMHHNEKSMQRFNEEFASDADELQLGVFRLNLGLRDRWRELTMCWPNPF